MFNVQRQRSSLLNIKLFPLNIFSLRAHSAKGKQKQCNERQYNIENRQHKNIFPSIEMLRRAIDHNHLNH